MQRINIAKARMEWMQVLKDADEPPVLKRLHVCIHHSTYPPFKLQILPGTKVSDVLTYLHLPEEDYVLCPLDDPQKHYTSTEVLYVLIESGTKLVAKLSPEAERRYATLFMQ